MSKNKLAELMDTFSGDMSMEQLINSNIIEDLEELITVMQKDVQDIQNLIKMAQTAQEAITLAKKMRDVMEPKSNVS